MPNQSDGVEINPEVVSVGASDEDEPTGGADIDQLDEVGQRETDRFEVRTAVSEGKSVVGIFCHRWWMVDPFSAIVLDAGTATSGVDVRDLQQQIRKRCGD